jgi:hypothetical protein
MRIFAYKFGATACLGVVTALIAHDLTPPLLIVCGMGLFDRLLGEKFASGLFMARMAQ